MLSIALTWRQYISSWLHPFLASAWWSYLSPSLAVHMSCVYQQLSLLLLRQHSRTGHTSELLVGTYHCTGGLQTCWIVPAGIVALLWHPVTSSKYILVYCKVRIDWDNVKVCHQIDWDNVKVLEKEPKAFPRKVLKAIHIRNKGPNLNRDKGLDLDPEGQELASIFFDVTLNCDVILVVHKPILRITSEPMKTG